MFWKWFNLPSTLLYQTHNSGLSLKICNSYQKNGSSRHVCFRCELITGVFVCGLKNLGEKLKTETLRRSIICSLQYDSQHCAAPWCFLSTVKINGNIHSLFPEMRSVCRHLVMCTSINVWKHWKVFCLGTWTECTSLRHYAVPTTSQGLDPFRQSIALLAFFSSRSGDVAMVQGSMAKPLAYALKHKSAMKVSRTPLDSITFRNAVLS